MAKRSAFLPAFRDGDRVEIAPRFDQWMRGDRYGDVVKHSERFGVYVKMDKSGRTLRFAPEDLTAINPRRRRVTRKARRFVSRKIRKLAREGVQAPRRVAEALTIARRRGFKIPRRRNPHASVMRTPRSESVAWKTVLAHAEKIVGADTKEQGNAQAIAMIARGMIDQLAHGIHTNPAVAILGNPGGKRKLGRQVDCVYYLHAQDGKRYQHEFRSGAEMWCLPDGSVLIRHRAGKPLWKDFP